MQDGGGFRHLDHEGGAAAGQVVAGADAGEHAVHQSQPRRTRGNERSHLRHDHGQRGLPQISGLAAHVRAGQHHDGVRGRIQIKIVGHEAVAAAQLQLLDDRVAPGDDFDVGGIVELRAAVIAQGRDVGQRRQHIDFGQRQRGLADAAGFSGNRRAQLGKQPALDFDDLFLGIENLGFVFFQLRRGEALGVDQGLLALVVGRGQVRDSPSRSRGSSQRSS